MCSSLSLYRLQALHLRSILSKDCLPFPFYRNLRHSCRCKHTGYRIRHNNTVKSMISSRMVSRILHRGLRNTCFHRTRRNNRDYRRTGHNSRKNKDYNNCNMGIRCNNSVRMTDTSLNKRDRASRDQSNYHKIFSVCLRRSNYRNSHNLLVCHCHNNPGYLNRQHRNTHLKPACQRHRYYHNNHPI